MPTILLADDHSLVRDTIAAYLTQKGGFTVTAVADLDEARVALSARNRIDLAIFDYQMPGMDGLNGLIELRKQYPDLKTAIISGVASPDVVEQALGLGAVAYFSKSMAVNLMVDQIHQILSQGADGDVCAVDGKTEGAVQNRFGLTPREAQILQMLALGQSNKLIAQDLALKEVTVKFHVSNIMTKLDVTNRTQAALRATEALAI